MARAALAGVPIYTSSPGDSSIGMNIAYHELMNGSTLMIDPNQRRQRGLRDHPRGKQERLRHSRRRIAEELLPAGAADALGGLRHSQGRQRLLHPDHDRLGRVGRPVRRDTGRGGQLGQGESRACCPTPSSPTATRRSRFPLFCEYAVGSEHSRRPRKELVHKRDAMVADLLRQAKEAQKTTTRRSSRSRRTSIGTGRRLGLAVWTTRFDAVFASTGQRCATTDSLIVREADGHSVVRTEPVASRRRPAAHLRGRQHAERRRGVHAERARVGRAVRARARGPAARARHRALPARAPARPDDRHARSRLHRRPELPARRRSGRDRVLGARRAAAAPAPA